MKDEQGLSTSSQVLFVTTLKADSVAVDKINDTGITICANDNTIFSQCNVTNLRAGLIGNRMVKLVEMPWLKNN